MLYLVVLAAADPTSAPLWASLVAVILGLIAVFPQVLNFASGKKAAAEAPKSPEPLAAVLTELTRAMHDTSKAYGRLADVLDRIEADSAKNSEDVRRRLEELGKLVERLDYRTKEILKHVERPTNNGD